MTAMRIVPPFLALKNVCTRLGLRPKPLPVVQLAFEDCEEALAHRDAIAVAGRRGGHLSGFHPPK